MHYIRNPIFINVFLLVLAAVLGYAAFSMAKQAVLVMREATSVSDSLEKLEAKEKKLELAHAELDRPEAVEREAKERLNLKLPGERVVVVVPDNEDGDSDPGSNNFWSRIRSLISRTLDL